LEGEAIQLTKVAGALLGPPPMRRMFTVGAPSSRADSRLRRTWSGLVLARWAPPLRHRDVMVTRTTDGAVSRHDVLLLSVDPLAAALLGAAVELAGHAPHFPQPGETPRDALRRLRPRAVLIDCDHETCSEEFVGPALMIGARVQLFRSRRTKRDANGVARRLGLSVVELPMEPDALTALLRDLPSTSP
jgi:hypothetical protein